MHSLHNQDKNILRSIPLDTSGSRDGVVTDETPSVLGRNFIPV